MLISKFQLTLTYSIYLLWEYIWVYLSIPEYVSNWTHFDINVLKVRRSSMLCRSIHEYSWVLQMKPKVFAVYNWINHYILLRSVKFLFMGNMWGCAGIWIMFRAVSNLNVIACLGQETGAWGRPQKWDKKYLRPRFGYRLLSRVALFGDLKELRGR